MFRKNDGVTYRIVDGEAVILNINTDQYYSLNKTGTFVFEKLLEGQNVEQIASELAEAEGVSAEVCLKDIQDLIKELQDEQIIVGAAD